MKRKIEISEIVKLASEEKSQKTKVDFLKKHDSFALRVLLSYLVDDNIQFDLPKGRPPFENSKFDEPAVLYNKFKKLYMFIKNHPIAERLKPAKKELIFINLLEYVNPNEAEFLIDIKDKKLPKGLTKQTILKFLSDVKHETIIAQ